MKTIIVVFSLVAGVALGSFFIEDVTDTQLNERYFSKLTSPLPRYWSPLIYEYEITLLGKDYKLTSEPFRSKFYSVFGNVIEIKRYGFDGYQTIKYREPYTEPLPDGLKVIPGGPGDAR